METILSWVIIIISVGIMLFGAVLLYMLMRPIFDRYQLAIKSGQLMTFKDLKGTLMTVGITAVSMLVVPFVMLSVILASLELSIPVMDDLTTIVSDYALDLVGKVTGDTYTTTSTNDVIISTPVPDTQSGGGAPPVVIYATATPHVIVIDSNPPPTPVQTPFVLPTPEPTKTLE